MNSARTIGIISALLGLAAFVGVLVLAPVDAPRRRQATPATPGLNQLIGSIRAALAEDRDRAALNLAENAIEQHPDRPDAWMWMGITAELNRDPTTATQAGRLQLELLGNAESLPNPEVSGWTAVSDRLYRLGWGHRLIGEEPEARVFFSRAADALEQETRGGPSQFAEYNLACYRALAGQHDRAAAHFARAVELGYARDNGWWRADPDLDPIRGHPVFVAAGNALSERVAARRTDQTPPPAAADQAASPAAAESTDGG